MGALVAGLSAVFASNVVISNPVSRTTSSSNIASLAGLSVPSTIVFTSMLSWVVRCFAQTEAAMTAVERLLFYIEKTPHEAPLTSKELPLASTNDGTYVICIMAHNVLTSHPNGSHIIPCGVPHHKTQICKLRVT